MTDLKEKTYKFVEAKQDFKAALAKTPIRWTWERVLELVLLLTVGLLAFPILFLAEFYFEVVSLLKRNSNIEVRQIQDDLERQAAALEDEKRNVWKREKFVNYSRGYSVSVVRKAKHTKRTITRDTTEE